MEPDRLVPLDYWYKMGALPAEISCCINDRQEETLKNSLVFY